jgi:hypothetical protein
LEKSNLTDHDAYKTDSSLEPTRCSPPSKRRATVIGIMMNNRRASRILLLLVGRQFFRIAEASTAFSIHSDPTCTNGLSMSNVQMVCDDDSSGGSSTCFLGDSAHVTGTLSIPDSGLFGNSMTTQACLYGFYPCHQLETNGDFCDTFGLSSYGCPTTGEFSVEKTFKLPGDQGLSLGKTFVLLCFVCCVMARHVRHHCLLVYSSPSRRSVISQFHPSSTAT